ncbi:MAG: L,D-transpeptidase family protein, partial [Hyphomicrobiaceae bacterium]
MIGTQPTQSRTLLAIAFICSALLSSAASLGQDWTYKLRPTLAQEPLLLSSGLEADAIMFRFRFVPPGAGIVMLEQLNAASLWEMHEGEILEVASNPETWVVEVERKPLTQSPFRSPKRKTKRRGPYSLSERLKLISPGASVRLQKKFASAKASWPPTQMALVAVKDERALDLYGRSDKEGAWTFIHRYPVLAASGKSGPKLRRGDKQVPEGIYRITYLNPNSRYHVSMRVNYPNAFDRKMAAKDGRRDLGGDIMIHGKKSSAGCLAIGDPAIEEIFVLAAKIGVKNIKLIIAP